ncbi:MAG: flagellar basal body rod protein FlgC [Holosporales bacterium]|jgi:flagellar basal-body rod protein FlgC
MELKNSMNIAVSGMKAQEMRLRVVAENIANADSLATTPGGEPYRRKLIEFSNIVDPQTKVSLLNVKRISRAQGELKVNFDPSHPAADKNGYVKMPNVNRFIETMDMKEAQRSFSANLEVLEASRSMLRNTVNLLSSQ